MTQDNPKADHGDAPDPNVPSKPTNLKSIPYDPKTYRLLTKEDIIIYQPNCISIRRKVISA